MTASVSQLYGQRPISERQLARLYAIAYGVGGEPGALPGNKREKAQQLWELIQRWGYDDWSAVDRHVSPHRWLRECDYEEIIGELLAMKGGL